MLNARTQKRRLGYLVAVVVVAAATTVLKLFGDHINHTTVAIALLLVVLFVATAWGPKPAVLASFAAGVCFNFFFLPPVGTFTIADPENWIAFFAFLVTAITAGQLSARARRRAQEATAARQEIEQLYRGLQDTFEQASQAQALKQSEQLKSALLDAVTHDLRTPLTSIKASVTTLLDDQQSIANRQTGIRLSKEARQEMLEVIDEETDRLDRFVEDLMALARIEAGEMQLRREWGSLSEIIATALQRAAKLTKEHLIDLRLQKELPSVRVDERAVAEVIYNLIDNAAKYSPPGSVITVSAQAAEDDMIRVAVEDQGRGIPIELHERVFDKFFRAMRDGSLPIPQTGTGMGLAIAKGIVEAHGGRIWIESGTASTGTKVMILMPTGDIEESQKQNQDAPNERQATHTDR